MSDIIYEKWLDKAYEDKRGDELLDSPVFAISGVTQDDAEGLALIGIETIRDLAQNRFVVVAQRLVQLETGEALDDCPFSYPVSIRLVSSNYVAVSS